MQAHRRVLLLALACLALTAFPTPAEPERESGAVEELVRIEISFLAVDEVVTPPGGLIGGEIQRAGRAVPGGVDPPENPHGFSLPFPGATELEIEPGRWHFEVETPDLWAVGEFEVEGEEKPQRLEVAVHPAAELTAEIALGPGETLPERVSVAFTPAPAADAGTPSGTSSCRHEGEAGLRCKVPLGLFDLRFEAAGFAPLYLWDVAVSEDRNLGRLDVRTGSSLSGWVVAPDRSTDLGKTELELGKTALELVEHRAAVVTEPTVTHVASVGTEPAIQLSKLTREDFELRGLEPGRYRLSATLDESSTPRRGSSRQIEVEVVDGAELGPITLAIEESLLLDGQVIAPSGAPVAGAQVFAEVASVAGESLGPFLPQTASDAAGVFRLELPAAAERILVTVLAPGFALHQLPHDLDRHGRDLDGRNLETPLLVPLDTAAGTLLVTSEDSGSTPVPELARRTFLVHDYPIQTALLGLWEQLQGPREAQDAASWRLEAMPPGSYRACLRTPEILPFLTSVTPLPAAWLDRVCGGADYLSPGGELWLEVPTEAR